MKRPDKIALFTFGAFLTVLPFFSPVLADTVLRVDERMESRWDRRQDGVENTTDGIKDRSEFRQKRRDCIGDGSDCRQDNRHDRAKDGTDRAKDRRNDRSKRLKKRF